MNRLTTMAAACALGSIALAASLVPANAQTLPQATPAPQASSAAATPAGTHLPRTHATPAPPKDPEDNRVGISGVWEIALQKPDGVTYTHFKLTQTGSTLTGQYLDDNGKKFPLAGTIDGKNVHLVVTLPNGTALVFSGTQDGNTDMVGTLSTATDVVGFTAAYRPKFKCIDNISPGGSALGGVGNPGGVP